MNHFALRLNYRTLEILFRALVAFALALPATSHALTLHISPLGDDSWSGKNTLPFKANTNGPLASLAGARNVLRALRQNGALTQPVYVEISSGHYPMTEAFELEPQDSGSSEAPIIFEAAPGAHPIFDGGVAIRGWRPSSNGLWQTHLSEVAAGQWYFEQLWVNGRRATRARSPDKFFYLVDVHQSPPIEPYTGRVVQATQTVQLRPDAFQVLASLSPAQLKDVNFIVYHSWESARCFISELDPGSNSFITHSEGLTPWNPWRKNERFILENYFAALDSPGEWFLDRDGTLFYKPLPGENPARSEISAPKLEKLVFIHGDALHSQFVHHITFRGLTFQHNQWLIPEEGIQLSQAANRAGTAITADDAQDITFDHCEFSHLAGYALWFRHACSSDTIRHCNFFDLGAGGVRIGETEPAKDIATQTAGITVDNNLIRHGGKVAPAAVGVWIGQSSDNQITHNEIADFYYTGISVGWSWGYNVTQAQRNTIAFNHVHHLGQGLLSDLGGFYSLGRSEGTVVANNVFHDIFSYSYGGWGLYTDEGSTGILFENNLVYDTKTGGLHQHYGMDNVFRNNIFAFSRGDQLEITRPEPHLSFTFQNNIIISSNSTALGGSWDKLHYDSFSNCFWNTGSKPLNFLGRSLAEWQSLGHEQKSILADPHFANALQHNFSLAPNSPALAIGFHPFDYTQAGVYGDREWIQRARREKYPPLVIPDPPPK